MGIAIRLKEVSFKYDGAAENVLENINLTVDTAKPYFCQAFPARGKAPCFL